ncbi:MAG: magnesium transporter [Rhizobiaceae bacterium]|jgi:magnesium transporter|nr:magnesium transporter [Rhizobiaceae bacterium]
MEENLQDTQPELTPDEADASLFYTEDGHVVGELVSHVGELIEDSNGDALAELIEPLHESELGDLLEALPPQYRSGLIRLTGDRFDFSSLTEIDEAMRLEIVNELPNEQIADVVAELESDDAVYILEDMEESDRDEILSMVPFEEQTRLRRSLEYPEETAGRRMQTEFIAVPPFWSVGQTIDFLREDDDLPERFHEVFVVDPSYKLMGHVALDRILRTQRKTKIASIQEKSVHPVDANLDQEEAARILEQYDLVSAAVVDEHQRLVGVLTIDDVVDVIQQEADEDIKRLAGVGDEELSDNVLSITRSRFTWLFLNLITAILASLVIGLFDATIQQMVALAILMPIVASMGGNAGTQSMTVTVRALATRDIGTYNMFRTIRREFLVGLLNGCSFAILIGVVSAIWFSNTNLGVIIGIAMIINMLCAALSGILIPIALDRMKVDPAIASSVFVTTVTDVVGFFAFLGLAAWWFGI